MRYLVFAGECYYAKGGANDFQKAFDSIDDAIEYTDDLIPEEPAFEAIEWWHIFDCEEQKITNESECQAHGT